MELHSQAIVDDHGAGFGGVSLSSILGYQVDPELSPQKPQRTSQGIRTFFRAHFAQRDSSHCPYSRDTCPPQHHHLPS